MCSLSRMAEEYVDLTLTKHQYHDKWDVYWFADTPFWKRTDIHVSRETPVYPYKPAPQMPAMGLDEILERAVGLCGRLEQARASVSGNDAIRLEFLLEHVRSLIVKTRVLSGEKVPYDTYTAEMFGLVAPRMDEGPLAETLEQLNDVLPGKGGLDSRMERFREQIRIPEDRVPAVMDRAAVFFHRIAVENMGVKDSNMPRLRYRKMGTEREFVTVLYGYDYDEISLEQNFSLDFPYSLDNIREVAGHELEPGHFTFMSLRTKGMVDTSYPELGLNSHGPSSAFIEAGARLSIEMALDTPEKEAALDEELFALAGADKGLIACLPLWRRYMWLTGYGLLEIERNRWDGVWTREQAVEFARARRVILPSDPDSAIERFAGDGGHYTSHIFSTDTLRRYFNKKYATTGEKWAAYAWMCQYPFVMRRIVDGTFDPFDFKV